MSKYICDRCRKEFKKKSNLDDHLRRKKPCKLYEGTLTKETEKNHLDESTEEEKLFSIHLDNVIKQNNEKEEEELRRQQELQKQKEQEELRLK